MRPMLAILVIAALISNVAVVEAFAQTKPDDFVFAELIAAIPGMVAGGFVGGIGGVVGVVVRTMLFGSSNAPCTGFGWWMGSCPGFSELVERFVSGGTIGLAIGAAIGATAGVSAAGSFFGVEGNLWLSLLLSSIGVGAGIYAAGVSDNLIYWAFCPVGATLGYNFGAIMKDEAPTSSEHRWKLDIPAFELRF